MEGNEIKDVKKGQIWGERACLLQDEGCKSDKKKLKDAKEERQKRFRKKKDVRLQLLNWRGNSWLPRDSCMFARMRGYCGDWEMRYRPPFWNIACRRMEVGGDIRD